MTLPSRRDDATAPASAAARRRSAPVRLLTLTTLFPNAQQPRHGIFIANRLRRLCDTGRVKSTVIASLPWFPGAYRHGAGVPRRESIFGFDVSHPRYFHIPGLGMRMQPRSLAGAIARELARRGLSADDFDVVDAHYFYPDGVAATEIARMLRRPLVISARGSDVNLIGNMRFARQRMVNAANQAAAVIAVSGALGRRMRELGMPADRLHVLRNGVDVGVFAPADRREARRRLRLAETGPLVLGVGNLVPEKGFELLVKAVAAMPRARLLLVGEGPRLSALRALADACAPGRVEFRPNMAQPELRFAYCAADVLGLPSTREGWPNVVLEAIACGTPVVAAAVGGVPEILGPDAPGRVLAQRDAATWADALANTVERTLPPSLVRAHALGFGWDDVLAKQCALYERVAAREPVATGECASEAVSAHA